MQIKQIEDTNNVYKIYYIVIAVMCILILVLFNLLINNRVYQHKEAMINEIESFVQGQTYNIDRGMESMLNTVYIQRGALEDILSSEETAGTNSTIDKLKYNDVYHATYLDDETNHLGNILIQGKIDAYTEKEKMEIGNLYGLFEIQNLLQKYTIFDIWSVYYSEAGYLMIYPYSTIQECIPEGEKFEIKGLVVDSIERILAENDPSIIDTGWETDAFYDLKQKVLMFSKSLPVRKNDEIVGILTCNMNVEDISDFITPFHLKTDMYIVDNSGRIIYENGNFSSELTEIQMRLHNEYDISLDEYAQIANTQEKITLNGLHFFSSRFKNTNWTLITVANNSIIEYGAFDKTGVYIGGNFFIVAFASALIILLRKYHKKVQEVETMKTDFLMTISHDLKSPMMLIMGHFGQIKEKLKKDQLLEGEIEHGLAIIENESTRLRNLINNILELSKLRFSEVKIIKSKIDAKEILEEVKALIDNEAAKKQIQIRMNIETDTPNFYGDKEMLTRVLINLATNALDATEKGEIVFTARNKEESICIEVSDTGCGMTPKEQVDIFSSFHTNKKQGTGLGLSIAKNIIEKHNGKIGCRSEEGKGSTFYFFIPVE